MKRRDTNRTEAHVAVGTRPCAPMHGWSAPQIMQGFDLKTVTGTPNSAHRLPGAPT